MDIQNCHISCKTGLADRSGLFLMDIATGWFMKYDLASMKYEIIGRLQGAGTKAISVMRSGQDFYFAFSGHTGIVEYESEGQRFSQYEVKQVDESEIKVRGAVQQDGSIWQFFPLAGHPARKFDLQKKKFVKSISFYKDAYKEYEITKIIQVGDAVWFGIEHTAYIVSVNLKDESVRHYELSKGREIETIGYDENSFFVSFYDEDYILRWVQEDGTEEIFPIKTLQRTGCKKRIVLIYHWEGSLFCIPAYDKKISSVNLATGQISDIELPQDCEQIFYKERFWFYDACQQNGNLLLLPWGASCFLNLDMETGKIRTASSRLLLRDLCRKPGCGADGIVTENTAFALGDYIHILAGE